VLLGNPTVLQKYELLRAAANVLQERTVLRDGDNLLRLHSVLHETRTVLRDLVLPVNLYVLREHRVSARRMVLRRHLLQDEAVRKPWLRGSITCPSRTARLVLVAGGRNPMGGGAI
jgi:hypothetical protein